MPQLMKAYAYEKLKILVEFSLREAVPPSLVRVHATRTHVSFLLRFILFSE